MTTPADRRDFSEFTFEVKPAADLTPDERACVHGLFAAAYRQANAAYLDRALSKLKYIALAMQGATAAGFACGESRVIDLPRLPQQLVTLAGICCIDPQFRRRGLFGKLEQLALMQDLPHDTATRLMLRCGRMAHPASMRTMQQGQGVVPKRGVPPTPWQREVGAAIAEVYGSPGFDPETFVVQGGGVPIGYPDMTLEVAPDEWEIFAKVNRDHGDSLLGLSWSPAPPEGW